MYCIAGLTLPLPPTQAVEGLVVLTTFRFLQYGVSRMRAAAAVAKAEAGAIRTLPTTFIGKVVSPVHGIAGFITPVTYLLCVTVNRFMQPGWMQRMSLPHNYTHQETEVALRVAACASTFVLLSFMGRALKHLGNQWHGIGRREKPKLVQTGPYAVVRHPVYIAMLIQQALFSVMFWSYTPLVALGIVAAAFAMKMPIEEELIMKDPAVGAEYRAYMQRVPARVIPFVW
ncbi:hypothetical protein AZE42_09374 [Rhizopogon vesiculosus]|uniref:Protein-S-isoprenylcysteine O-methyltransferase n=1 Tax=Rhizopogon vesiculosus TaxID=180088 RepID=A0A1J8PNP8_9AGAM|nr:hypothetical protein AZE42_09374 [Rhizopogon vesiculosus]